MGVPLDFTQTLVHGGRNDRWINGPSQNLDSAQETRNMISLSNPQTLIADNYGNATQSFSGLTIAAQSSRSYGIAFSYGQYKTWAIMHEMSLEIDTVSAGDRPVAHFCGLLGPNVGTANSGQTGQFKVIPQLAGARFGQFAMMNTKGYFAINTEQAPGTEDVPPPIWLGYSIINRETDPITVNVLFSIAGRIAGTGPAPWNPSL